MCFVKGFIILLSLFELLYSPVDSVLAFVSSSLRVCDLVSQGYVFCCQLLFLFGRSLN